MVSKKFVFVLFLDIVILIRICLIKCIPFLLYSNQQTGINSEESHQDQDCVKSSETTMHGGAAADYFRSTAYQPYTAGPTTAMFHPHQVSSAVSGSMFHHHPAALAAAAAQQQMAAAASGAVMPHPTFGSATPGGHNPTYGTGGVIAPHPQRLFPAAAAAAAAAVVGGGPGNNHLFSQTSSHLHQQQHQQQMYEQLSGKKNYWFLSFFFCKR